MDQIRQRTACGALGFSAVALCALTAWAAAGQEEACDYNATVSSGPTGGNVVIQLGGVWPADG